MGTFANFSVAIMMILVVASPLVFGGTNDTTCNCKPKVKESKLICGGKLNKEMGGVKCKDRGIYECGGAVGTVVAAKYQSSCGTALCLSDGNKWGAAPGCNFCSDEDGSCPTADE
ncbi:uncharacterized protein LOC118436931 [Folsomia candida]|uniref:uncharacterized protein LOC118436931 n=1 Tax=Folsomia candida TaxID=158441 RepID=UPI0016054C19|nr:uncharacterized protein LOC118436931 [Folsomia candida]